MNSIYNEIARRHNVTSEEVEKEINLAISLARKNPSPTARAFWEGIDNDADIEDIICRIIERIGLIA